MTTAALPLHQSSFPFVKPDDQPGNSAQTTPAEPADEGFVPCGGDDGPSDTWNRNPINS